MMGRPPKKPNDVKSVSIRIRTTKAEYARLTRAAEKSGDGLSAWARAALLVVADELLRKPD